MTIDGYWMLFVFNSFLFLSNSSNICDVCSPTRETHTPSDMCSPTKQQQQQQCIPSDMCSLTWETLSLVICVPPPGKNYP